MVVAIASQVLMIIAGVLGRTALSLVPLVSMCIVLGSGEKLLDVEAKFAMRKFTEPEARLSGY